MQLKRLIIAVVPCCHCHLMLFILEKQTTSLYELDQTALIANIAAPGKSHNGKRELQKIYQQHYMHKQGNAISK